MPMSLQEISDRFEIQDLLVRYSHCIDTFDWNGLDDVFTEDAIIDYSQMGGFKGTLGEAKAYLEGERHKLKGWQHMLGNMAVQLDGDRASARTILHNPIVLPNDHVMVCGLWYVDELIRTPAGWRISHRVEEKSHFANVPKGFSPVDG